MIKADFHIHTSEDYHDRLIKYSAKDIIKYASKLKFNALSITNHHNVYYNTNLRDYAKKKGITLIPGAEMVVEGKEVLVLNLERIRGLRRYDDLDKIKKEGGLIIAPHPFYPKTKCLGKDLIDNIQRFDAIEYSHFYTGRFTSRFNKKAQQVAVKYDKPLVGTSDAHRLYQFDNTYTLLDCDNKRDDIVDSVIKGKVKVVSKPLSYVNMLKHLSFMKSCFMYRRLGIQNKGRLNKKF